VEGRRYDKIALASHYNAHTNMITITFPKFAAVYDISNKAQLYWNLPDMNVGMPLCITSCADDLVIAYDSNKIVIFDLVNKKLHDWSKQNLNKMP
jgi:hypothetical protein